MACNIINGLIAQTCRESQGGISEFYIANFDSVTGVTESDSEVTTIETSGETATFYRFKPNKNSGNWSQPIMGSPESGTIGYEHTAVMTFSKNQADDINTIKIMARASVIIIVKERSGNYYLLGKDEGLTLESGEFVSGSNLEDLNGWTLTFSGAEKEPAPQVDESIIDALIAE